MELSEVTGSTVLEICHESVHMMGCFQTQNLNEPICHTRPFKKSSSTPPKTQSPSQWLAKPNSVGFCCSAKVRDGQDKYFLGSSTLQHLSRQVRHWVSSWCTALAWVLTCSNKGASFHRCLQQWQRWQCPQCLYSPASQNGRSGAGSD